MIICAHDIFVLTIALYLLIAETCISLSHLRGGSKKQTGWVPFFHMHNRTSIVCEQLLGKSIVIFI